MSSEATATTPRVSCLELDLLRGAHQASAPPLAQAILSLRRQTCGCSDVPWVDGGEYSHGSCGPKFCLEDVPWRSLGFPDQIPLSSGAGRCSLLVYAVTVVWGTREAPTASPGEWRGKSVLLKKQAFAAFFFSLFKPTFQIFRLTWPRVCFPGCECSAGWDVPSEISVRV